MITLLIPNIIINSFDNFLEIRECLVLPCLWQFQLLIRVGFFLLLLLRSMIRYFLTFFSCRYKWMCPESSALCLPMCKHLWVLWMQMSCWICFERRQEDVQRWDIHVQAQLSQKAVILSMMRDVPPKLPLVQEGWEFVNIQVMGNLWIVPATFSPKL